VPSRQPPPSSVPRAPLQARQRPSLQPVQPASRMQPLTQVRWPWPRSQPLTAARPSPSHPGPRHRRQLQASPREPASR
jgi:hypothetical protein